MMRPTAASASKTLDKPVTSPPRRAASTRAPPKPKATGSHGVVAKAKQKAAQGVEKVKDTVTTNNSHRKEGNAEEASPPTETGNVSSAEAPQESAQVQPESTPTKTEEVEFSSVDVLQTPQFEGETIR
jgi:hypothetical protein